ncbi:hypothetical protein H2200_008322 [Cladophialophora chaetospira]|uniref:F-box domain-containing protein n=1 Tax=Cladophialophora chaetospira TaxID=386627 RepID=A0AA38X5N1_9EURO|nr:hypothetical protein H2200_008322 [Cladophialophora chaetospira]
MATSCIPQLPQEILQLIISFLDGSGLKNARLSSKTFAMMAEPLLFERMVIVPYVDCLEGFQQMMTRNRRIASFVRTVHYDAESRYDDNWEAVTTHDSSALALEKLERFCLTAKDEATEVVLLSECLSALPSVTSLSVQEASNERTLDYEDNLLPSRSAYFARLLRTASNDFHLNRSEKLGGFAMQGSRTILLACIASGSKIRNFDASGLNSRNFLRCGHADGLEEWSEDNADALAFPKELPLFVRMFQLMRNISLDFEDFRTDFPPHHDSDATVLLGKVLASAYQLETLFIHGIGGRSSHDHSRSWLSALMRVKPQSPAPGVIRTSSVFPNMRVLHLKYFACQESELIALVRLHKATLQKLQLNTMFLLNDQETPNSPACYVRLLKAIRTCRIPEVELAGIFINNAGHQQWQIGGWSGTRSTAPQTDAKASLQYRVHQWVSGKGEETTCPLENMAVRLDASGQVIVPSADGQNLGDPSWTVLVPSGRCAERRLRILRLIYRRGDRGGERSCPGKAQFVRKFVGGFDQWRGSPYQGSVLATSVHCSSFHAALAMNDKISPFGCWVG